ncbi:VTC domain-containing protein [Candidatus Latescibacterota bacterium]
MAMKYEVHKMKFEYKYLVPCELLPELRTLISPFMEKDSNMNFGGRDGYTVRSIYFDTPGYDFYHEKKDGLKIRKKLRIRGYNSYNPENFVFLEIKRKNARKLMKNRAAVPYKHLNDLLFKGNAEKYVLTDRGFKEPIENAQRFLFNFHKSSLQPVVLVIYEREAFFGKFDSSMRVTFDKNLRSSIDPDLHQLYKEENIKYTAPGNFVLEVKFYDIFPSWMNKIIFYLGLKLVAFSKYTRCIDEHREINNNSRMLLRDFTHAIHL